jgi:sodium transport system permease protein
MGVFLYGSAISNLVSEDNTVPAIVYTENVPSEFMTILTAEEADFLAEFHELESFEVTYQSLRDGNVDFILIFPDTFETDIASDIKPNIDYYYNANEGKSTTAYNTILSLLMQYEAGLVYDEYGDTDIFLTEEHMIIDEQQAMASAMSMMLPFLIITFLFQGAMTLGPESIAGEKERGTISTLLITPTKRRDLALGKILALSILASLSAASSFIGIIASLPKLMGIEATPIFMDLKSIHWYWWCWLSQYW